MMIFAPFPTMMRGHPLSVSAIIDGGAGASAGACARSDETMIAASNTARRVDAARGIRSHGRVMIGISLIEGRSEPVSELVAFAPGCCVAYYCVVFATWSVFSK